MEDLHSLLHCYNATSAGTHCIPWCSIVTLNSAVGEGKIGGGVTICGPCAANGVDSSLTMVYA